MFPPPQRFYLDIRSHLGEEDGNCISPFPKYLTESLFNIHTWYPCMYFKYILCFVKFWIHKWGYLMVSVSHRTWVVNRFIWYMLIRIRIFSKNIYYQTTRNTTKQRISIMIIIVVIYIRHENLFNEVTITFNAIINSKDDVTLPVWPTAILSLELAWDSFREGQRPVSPRLDTLLNTGNRHTMYERIT